MGLDTVELVMEVEESFGIAIPDERACQMCTVGDLYSFILEETGNQRRASDRCLTAATFYALRRRLGRYVEAAASVRPKSRVDATLPRRKRRKLWAQLAQEMDLRFPRLRRPRWVVLLGCAALAGTTFLAYVLLASATAPSLAIFLACLIFVPIAAIIALATAPFALIPAESFRTYRGLVTQLVTLNYATLSERYETSKPTDVWNALQLIIVEQLGVKREAVTPDANLVNDLGCD